MDSQAPKTKHSLFNPSATPAMPGPTQTGREARSDTCSCSFLSGEVGLVCTRVPSSDRPSTCTRIGRSFPTATGWAVHCGILLGSVVAGAQAGRAGSTRAARPGDGVLAGSLLAIAFEGRAPAAGTRGLLGCGRMDQVLFGGGDW